MHVIETVPVSDTYCSGVTRIEKTPNGNIRLWCYTAQASDCGAGPLEHVLTAKLVFPAAALIPMVLMAMGAIDTDNAVGLSDAVAAACATVHH